MDNNNLLVLKIAELEKQIEIIKTENINLNNKIEKETKRFTNYLNSISISWPEQAKLYR
jgi:accessory colonization factor AcfC